MAMQSLNSKDIPNIFVQTVKISDFNPHLDSLHLKKRYSGDQIQSRRRSMVHTSFSPKRSFDIEPNNDRILQTSHQSRLSRYVQNQILKIQSEKDHIQSFTPFIREKIKELRILMTEKTIASRNSPIKEPKKYFYSEFKIQNLDQKNKQKSTLHSRNISDSPYSNSRKQKSNILNITRTLSPSKMQQNITNFQTKERKLLLFGDSISKRFDDSARANPETINSHKSKCRQNVDKIIPSSRYFIRQVHNLKKKVSLDLDIQNECRPWQIQQGNYHQHDIHSK